MKACYKVAVASPDLHLGDPAANVSEHLSVAKDAAAQGVAVLVFPELSLTGYTCGDLFFRPGLVDGALQALHRYAARTSRLGLVSVVGLPLREGASLYNAAAVVYGGDVVGYVRKRVLANYAEYYEKRQFEPAPADEPLTVFEVAGLRLGVEICEDLWAPIPPSARMAAAGLDLVLNLSASTDFLGKSAERKSMAVQQSARLRCAYALACAGCGESTADAVYGGGSLIAADGLVLAEAPLFAKGTHVETAVVDVEALRYRRVSDSSVRGRFSSGVETVQVAGSLPEADPEKVDPAPFLSRYGEPGWVGKLLTIQAVGLARRMRAARARKLVIGVSGGADSALALLGARKAVERLGEADVGVSLLAVVMPGFASSDATQSRAAALARAVGADVRVVDIRAACRQHLKDIGHAEDVHDLAFENVQARVRTLVLMDIANMEGALVVGTGDLSEIALGWNTYNGDHMSMYQINASVPKTMVLAALRTVAAESSPELRSVLEEIADAPITPELVPNAAANDSEARLGPYALHDFFLYHYLANGCAAEKLDELAQRAFSGTFPPELVRTTRDTFLRRFKAAQYKRKCVPDGPKITLSLSPRADWRMPSD